MKIISIPRIKLLNFKVTNYRCIDNTGWITVDDITTLIGINESGKTSLLYALLCVNPGSGEIDLNITRDFPRDRLSSERGNIPNLPVVSARFLIPIKFLENNGLIEKYDLENDNLCITLTRYYSEELTFTFQPEIENSIIPGLLKKLEEAKKKITRKSITVIKNVEEETEDIKVEEENTKNTKPEILFNTELKNEIISYIDNSIAEIHDWYDQDFLFKEKEERQKFKEWLDKNNLKLGEYFEILQIEIEDLLDHFEELTKEMQNLSKSELIFNEVYNKIPTFIYFEDYDTLEGEIVIPHLIKAINGDIHYNEFRIQETLFKHVGLDPKEIFELGQQKLSQKQLSEINAQIQKNVSADIIIQSIGEDVPDSMQEQLRIRGILLDSASQRMTGTLNKYFQEKNYNVVYKIDNQFLQILVSDNVRPSRINLSGRSKGFRWFFSFFLVFLVESKGKLKNSVLLLDEPGIHLHLQAQFNLLDFFKKIQDTNQILYTTHSPFLVDTNHLELVRSVYEDKNGLTQVTNDNTIPDKKSIFPLQAALSYSTSQVIYQGLKQLLVEGDTDFNYMKGINFILNILKKSTLSNDIVIIPCGSASKTELYSRMFIDLNNLPVVLLDSDDEGKKIYDKLIETLYSGTKSKNVLQIGDFVDRVEDPEIEDLIGKKILVKLINQNSIANSPITLKDLEDRPFVDAIEIFCNKNKIRLKNNWKYSLSNFFKNGVEKMSEDDINKTFTEEIIKSFEKLFKIINRNAQKKNPDFQFFENIDE